MKKVICIDDSEFRKNTAPKVPKIVVGDTLTVDKSYIDRWDNDDPVYEFAEFPYKMFSQRYFAEFDTDLDETTLVNEEWEQKYCEPVNQKSCV